MFVRTEALQNVGGFDFMYGEDIELSYQIKEAGYKIVYFPLTQIIHFKGESTKKLTSSYIKNFYGAMSIYAGKRNASSSFLWKWLLNIGILFSAITSLFKKVFAKLISPFIDIVALFYTARITQGLWANFYFNDPDYYNASSFNWLYLFLLGFIVFCYYLFGHYDRRHNIKHLLYGFVLSTLATLSIYSLMPSELRFSRIILLIIALVAPLLLYLTRKFYNLIFQGTFKFNSADGKRVVIVGEETSYSRIASYDDLGSVDSIKEIVDSRNINEVIFCSSDMNTTDIFKSMALIGDSVSVKLANNDNTTILGSTSKERVGEWYALDFGFKITEPFHRRTKRLLDVLFCIIAIMFFPLVLLFSSRTKAIYTNLFQVLLGQKSWLGYIADDDPHADLPSIRPSVFSIASEVNSSIENRHQENLWYARNYSTWTEFSLLLQKFLSR